MVQLLTRLSQAELAETVEAAHWSVIVILTKDAKDSLGASSLYPTGLQWPCHQKRRQCYQAQSILGHSEDTQNKYIHGGVHDPAIIASDASNVAACAYDVSRANGLFVQTEFTEQQGQMSSGQRELLAVLSALRSGADKLRHSGSSSRTVFWLTDSANLIAFLTKGSTKKHIQMHILAVFRMAREINLHLYPVHLHREDYRIQTADFGSR